MKINELSLNEIVIRYPGSRMVLEDFHFDYCCGGKQTLQHACEKNKLDPEAVIQAIERKAAHRDDHISFENWPADLLADYIEKKHHRYVQSALAQLELKLERLVLRHGAENPFLCEIQSTFQEMAGTLTAHMKKEELILFPYIRSLAKAELNGNIHPQLPSGPVSKMIDRMESEHADEGERLKQLESLTGHFTPPAHACATWQFVYEKLAEFTRDLHQHIFLENGILFPAAIRMAESQELRALQPSEPAPI